MTFSVADKGFELNGEAYQVISGSLHYFRVHPSQWADRMAKARQLGLNTIDTYIAWNFHSSRPGEFRLDGWQDLGHFLDLAAEHGLHAIVRPGPYICAEWRNAGLPTWLTAQDMQLRTADPKYLDAVAGYYAQVLPLVAERQITRGGNVIMVQVENEYGAYGQDKDYLRALVELIRAEGIDVPLFTCDQANDEMLERGSLPELLTTGTFGSRSIERLQTLRRHQPTGPLMCTEFWNGWFDSWGLHHHTTDTNQSAQDLDDLLGSGASVNLYMLHGGTNYGLNNGANHKGTYVPIVTSYDYDAPLSEDGSPTPKFHAFRDVIAKYSDVGMASPAEFEPAPTFQVPLTSGVCWRDALADPVRFTDLPTMDQIDHDAHFAVYSTEVAADDLVIAFEEIRDRAYFFLDDEPVGTLHRTQRQTSLPLPRRAGTLRILVEDLGRVNYASHLGEAKGLIGDAVTATRTINEWAVAPLDLAKVPALPAPGDAAPISGPLPGPVIVRAAFEAQAQRDLFLDTAEWGTGLVWLNGLLLGRYWSAGPTQTMYVPGPLVRAEGNELVVWELEALTRPTVKFVSHPQLGHTEE